MRLAIVVVAMSAGCGRIDFDPSGDGGPAQPIVADGLVAYYRMDAIVAQSVADDTGHGHTATCAAASTCPTLVPGVVGGALAFDGVDDMLTIASAPDLLTTSSFTVAAWFAFDVVPMPGQAMSVVAKGLATATSINDSWQISYLSVQQVDFFSVSAGAGDTIYSMTTVPAASWHHFAIRWDGAHKDLAIDGMSLSSDNDSAIDFDDSPITIAADIDNGNTTGSMTGRIDDLRIYDRALTDGELAQLAGI